MLPCKCPSCQCELKVRSLTCGCCSTEVTGEYDLPAISRLAPEEQDFVMQFVLSSGSLKEMASQLKLSYPTVRNRLDEIINRLKTIQQ